MNVETQVVFRNFANKYIERGEIPLKWKIRQIYLILKDTDWSFNLNNIRPIALLETFRKCTTKVFTIWLEKIIRDNEMLKGPNFAGLVGSSTESSLHILSRAILYTHPNRPVIPAV